jgi:hypothetical protein
MVILTHEDFSPHLNTTFRVETEEFGPLDLEFVELHRPTDGPSAFLPGGMREPFVLVFRGPAGPLLPEGLHTLGHAVMGDQEIYVVPLGPLGRTDALFYQAIFN